MTTNFSNRIANSCWIYVGVFLASFATAVTATEPEDKKSYFIKDLDGHFPFAVPATKEAWESRAKELREQIEVSLGLFPRPNLATIQPIIHSTQLKDGYAVEKVFFESLPGLFVTGNLYRPLSNESDPAVKRPAVLCPHGHWANGRFYFTSNDEANRELANGAERFKSAAHSPLQARCVQMARMGIIVFHYDMLGYADSQQISMQRAHGFGLHGPNPDVGADRWLLYSPKAEGMLQNIMGIQTINTLQSLEFLLQRSDVDPNRISITGASGGGTQTFLASAIEPRFAGAYPVVMVSTSMQGGCTCENASSLRVSTGNVEIAALTAPRPLGVNAANDWTRDMARDGFPELKRLYGLYGAEDRVNLHVATHFPHNYNHVTRVVMYGFMNRLFGLGLPEPILEEDFEVLKGEQLSVWDKDHPAPPGGIEFEADLLQRWAADVSATIAKSPEIRRQGWNAILRPAEHIAASLKVIPSSTENQRWRILNADGVEVGTVWANSDAKGIQSIQVTAGDTTKRHGDQNALLAVEDAWGIDMNTSVQSLVKNPRPAPCYTYGYNPPLFVRRLAVVLALLDAQGSDAPKWRWIGKGADANLLAAAAFLRPNHIRTALLTPSKADVFDGVESIRDAYLLPGALRFGGLMGLVAAQSTQSTKKQ